MILKSDYWYGREDYFRGPIYRPFPLILFATEWQFFPDNPMVYHLVNVLFYSLLCLLLYSVLCKLFEETNLLFPFVCTMLYAAHPIHTEVVDSIKSADEILAFLFALLSLFYFLKSIEKNSILYLLFGAVFYFISLLSKETAIAFFIVIPLMLYVFIKADFKRILLITSILFCTTMGMLLIRYEVLKSVPDNGIQLMNNSLVGAPDFISRKMTAFYVLLRYILLLLFPHPLSYNYTFNQIPICHLNNLPVLFGIVLCLAIFIYSIINIRKKSMIAFSILFFLLTIIPVSNIFMLIGSPMAERFLFMPSLGFSMLTTLFLIKITTAKAEENRILSFKEFIQGNSKIVIIVSILLCLYSIKTISRNTDWKDDVSLVGHDVEIVPNCASAHFSWGHILVDTLFLEEKDSVQKNKILDQGIDEFKKAVAIFNNYTDAYNWLAKAYILKKDYQNAISVYRILLHIDGDKDTADLNSLAVAYYDFGLHCNQTNQYEKSLNTFDSAIKYKPNFSESYNNKGVAYLELGKNTEAITEFEKAIKLDEKNHTAYSNIGCAYTNLKQYEMALQYLNKSISLDSSDHYPVYIKGVTYQLMGDTLKAKEYFEKANQKSGGQGR